MNPADFGVLTSEALMLDAGPVTQPPFQLPAADARKTCMQQRHQLGRCWQVPRFMQ